MANQTSDIVKNSPEGLKATPRKKKKKKNIQGQLKAGNTKAIRRTKDSDLDVVTRYAFKLTGELAYKISY